MPLYWLFGGERGHKQGKAGSLEKPAEAGNGHFPRASRRNTACQHPDFSPVRSVSHYQPIVYRIINLCGFKPTKFVVICYGSHRKLNPFPEPAILTRAIGLITLLGSHYFGLLPGAGGRDSPSKLCDFHTEQKGD